MLPPKSSSAAYPLEREAEIVLRDGSTVRVRPVRTGDKAQIRAFLDGLSPESIGFRFFGTPDLATAADGGSYDGRRAVAADSLGTLESSAGAGPSIRSVCASTALLPVRRGMPGSSIILAFVARSVDRTPSSVLSPTCGATVHLA